MGTSVVLGDTRLTVKRRNVAAFKTALATLDLHEHLKLKKNRAGDIVSLELISDRLIELDEIESLHPLVETGSYIGQETIWGDDAWRYTFTKKGISQRTVRCGERAS